MTSTPPSSILLVLFGSMVGSYGMVFLKKASKDLHLGLLRIINRHFVFGAALFVLSSFFYFLGIKYGEISVLYPMVAISYVWALVWAKLVFGEPFTRQKVLGLGFVLAGVVCVSLAS